MKKRTVPLNRPSQAAKAQTSSKKPTTPRAPSRSKTSSRTAGSERGRQLALAIAECALEHKAQNVEIIDVRGKVDYTDYVIVMSGRSDRQVAALSRYIAEDLDKNHGIRCLSVEGLPHGSWVLMDYGEIVVHLFHQDMRGYYDLESLWIDASRLSSGDNNDRD